LQSQTKTLTALAALCLAALLGCRGQTSEKGPLYIKHGMEFQPKFSAYGKTDFYPDHRTMRHPPEGTVALGLLKEDKDYWQGGADTAHYVAANPLKITAGLMERGQERYEIYCAPCHDRTGSGKGIVVQRGLLPPPSFHEDRVVAMPDGQLFHTITYGVRNMPSYGKQIPAEDRWAIVAYLRALQRSQRSTISDVPESERANLK
jgi:mono/diheme cytochrome c family protein